MAPHGGRHRHRGITPFAQEKLGDLVFVELPGVGAAFDKGAVAATVESVKAAADVYTPVAGESDRGSTTGSRTSLASSMPSDGQWLAVQDETCRPCRD